MVAAWFGQSVKVQRQSYAQITYFVIDPPLEEMESGFHDSQLNDKVQPELSDTALRDVARSLVLTTVPHAGIAPATDFSTNEILFNGQTIGNRIVGPSESLELVHQLKQTAAEDRLEPDSTNEIVLQSVNPTVLDCCLKTSGCWTKCWTIRSTKELSMMHRIAGEYDRKVRLLRKQTNEFTKTNLGL